MPAWSSIFCRTVPPSADSTFPSESAFSGTPLFTSFESRTSLPFLSLSSSEERISMATPSSTSSISVPVPLRSKRVWISFIACWMAFLTSWRSTLHTMSNELSSAMGPPLLRKSYSRAISGQNEETAEVGGGGLLDLLGREPLHLGKAAEGVSYEPGLVSLAPVGDGRQIRGVALDQESIERQAARHLAKRGRVLESEDPRERDEESHLQGALGGLQIGGERMQDAPDLAHPLLFENFQQIRFRLAVMDDDGKRELPRHPHLPAEDVALHLRRRQVVVVVEADLPYGEKSGPQGEAPQEILAAALVEDLGVVGMAADGG